MKRLAYQIEAAWHYFWKQWADNLPRPPSERFVFACKAARCGWWVWSRRNAKRLP